MRNTKVVDVYRQLQEYGMKVDIYDPWADAVNEEYDVKLLGMLSDSVGYSAIILAVAHR